MKHLIYFFKGQMKTKDWTFDSEEYLLEITATNPFYVTT